MRERHDGIVYSSEWGRMCPRCGKPVKACICKAAGVAPGGDGVVRVGYEKKGRKGHGMTRITGISKALPEMKALARTIKKRCGSGGGVKNGVIEIQGDHRDTAMAILRDAGFVVKKTGG